MPRRNIQHLSLRVVPGSCPYATNLAKSFAQWVVRTQMGIKWPISIDSFKQHPNLQSSPLEFIDAKMSRVKCHYSESESGGMSGNHLDWRFVLFFKNNMHD
jgi:hypothetical protein